MNGSRRLVIALSAEESAGVKLLRQLARGPHEIACVLTSRPGSDVRGATVWHVARTLEIETRPAGEVRDAALAARLEGAGVDLLLNVHSLHLIDEANLSAPRIGAFNLHPGPLPRYAGLNAPSHALRRGESSHGVTLHWMDPGIDTGRIAWQKIFPLTDDDTGLKVSARCIREGLALIETLLETSARDPSAIPRTPQDRSGRTYFGRKVPQSGRVLWNRPARRVFDLIRAADFHPLPSPWGTLNTDLGDGRLGIVRALPPGDDTGGVTPGTVSIDDSGVVLVACSDAWLPISLVRIGDDIQDAGKVLGGGERLGRKDD